jgi:hypothetical protein
MFVIDSSLVLRCHTAEFTMLRLLVAWTIPKVPFHNRPITISQSFHTYSHPFLYHSATTLANSSEYVFINQHQSGAKPAHGGMLPKEKITEAIAEARGLTPPYTVCMLRACKCAGWSLCVFCVCLSFVFYLVF